MGFQGFNRIFTLMKKLILYTAALMYLAGFSGIICQAQEMTDEEVLSAIKEHPYRAAACHSPYYAPEADYTPAPKGYKAFYISHIGRHGSRYQTHGDRIYDHVVAIMDSLHMANALTPSGDSLRAELRHIQQAHIGMDGMLTVRGSGEHTAIARRLAERCPGVFRQKDRKTVYCTSTTVQRTIQSMAGFLAGLKTSCPDLDYRIGCGFDEVEFRHPASRITNDRELDSLQTAEEKAMEPPMAEIDGLQTRLFKEYEASGDFLYQLFIASVSAGCLDIDVDPLRFFTAEELFSFYKKRDVSFNVKYGTFAPTREFKAKKGIVWLRRIIDDADDALDGNGHCADLRFAHDGNVGPMMNLLGIGGYAITALDDAPYRYWQSFRQICMGSNLQLEFYKNAKSDILVKALFNEKEIGFPGLEAVNNVYYKWSDVRRYMISKCEDVREVPDYYEEYIKGKAEEIRQLQKDELDGFYFITDMHFPVNYGNAAALMEYLENNTDKRLIVYGGDALTYVNDMEEGMAMQISALEQMRGVTPILWARGNHDIVNYTGKKEWITEERETLPAWVSSELLGRFRPMSAVTNAEDPYTAYCWYDSPGRKVRYIVFDTTDKVQDDNMQSGLSDTQLRWIVENAVLSAPKGYKLVFLSHIPFIGSKEKTTSAAAALCALSTHTAFELDGKTYDFANRPDLQLVCCVCGHRHSDYSKEFPGGQPQINVMADCNYENLRRTAGTVEEQSFDYISISKDGHTIHTVRIGKGEDRNFQSMK